MIIVHGTFPVKSDVRDEALELMRRMASASRAEFGCISYEFYIGLTDPNTLLLFQEWESVEALQGHFDTDHMEEFLKVLPEVLDGEVTTRRYEVRSSADPAAEAEDDMTAGNEDREGGAGRDDREELAEPEFNPSYEHHQKIIH